MLTGEWIAYLFSFGGETTLPETKRLERLEKKMLNKLSFGPPMSAARSWQPPAHCP